MQANALWRRLSSPTGFIVIAACFLLPFVTVSCSSAPGAAITANYTGADLVVGARADLTASEQVRERFGPTPTVDRAPLPTLAQIHDHYTKPIPVQPFMVFALVLLGVGIVAAAVPLPWPRALAESGLALGALVFLAAGEVLARHAAVTRITADATPYLGSASGTSPSGTKVTIDPRTGFGFWLAVSLLVPLVAATITRLVRLSTSAVTALEANRPP